MIEKKSSFAMFNEIAKNYDRNNRILSGGIDLYWRKKLIKEIPKNRDAIVLDLATGTGDQLFAICKKVPLKKAIGIDLSEAMLSIAHQKNQKYRYPIEFILEDATKLHLLNDSVHFVTMSFGIRNVEDPLLCLKEMYRVLEKGGKCLILEFSLPKKKWFQSIYLFYLRKILPVIGNFLSKHDYAYTYLNQTIETFPCGKEFLTLMNQAGFQTSRAKALSFGIATLYIGVK